MRKNIFLIFALLVTSTLQASHFLRFSRLCNPSAKKVWRGLGLIGEGVRSPDFMKRRMSSARPSSVGAKVYPALVFMAVGGGAFWFMTSDSGFEESLGSNLVIETVWDCDRHFEELSAELGSGWHSWSDIPKNFKDLRKSSDTKWVSKLIIHDSQGQALMMRKRAPDHPEKDGKLELIGGQVDSGETFLEALLRELDEEEESGAIRDLVFARLKNTPSSLRVQAVKVKGSEPHFVFCIELDEPMLSFLRKNPLMPEQCESYGIKIIPSPFVTKGDATRSLSAHTPLTPKTEKILLVLEPS